MLLENIKSIIPIVLSIEKCENCKEDECQEDFEVKFIDGKKQVYSLQDCEPNKNEFIREHFKLGF